MTELVVTTAHLQQLAAQQKSVADQIGSATQLTHGIGHSAWVNHGAISGPSNTAVVQAQAARHAAGKALQAAARGLANNLHTAALAYDNTDYHKADGLDHQIR